MNSDKKYIGYPLVHLYLEKWKKNKECIKNSTKIGVVLGGLLGIWIAYKMVGGLFFPAFNNSEKKLIAYQEFQQLRDMHEEEWVSFKMRDNYFAPNFILLIRKVSVGQKDDEILEEYFSALRMKNRYENVDINNNNKVVQAEYRDDINVSIMVDRERPHVFEITVRTR